jgi:NAD(P)H-flavin reductase
MYLDVPIEAVTDETDEMRLYRLALGAQADAYTTPGQYIKIKLHDKESYFAIASAPGGGAVEVLVRRAASGVAAALWDRQAGDRVPVSAPGGKGFPMAQAGGRDLILVAAGSGVGPMRAVIQWVLGHRGDFGGVTLFYGQRAHDHFAFAREQAAWETGGVRTVKVTSRDEAGEKRLAGYVQHAIADTRPEVDNAVAFIAGMKEMIAPVTESLVALGLPRDRIFMNF